MENIYLGQEILAELKKARLVSLGAVSEAKRTGKLNVEIVNYIFTYTGESQDKEQKLEVEI